MITACSGPSVVDYPTLRIGITPNLSSIQPGTHRCAAGLPIHLFLVEMSVDTLEIEDLDAIIHVGDPPMEANFVTQIGSLKLVILLNTANPISTMEPAAVKSILTGTITDWQVVSPGDFSNSTPIHVWSYPEEDDVRQLIEQTLLNGRTIASSSRIVPHEQAMIAAVMADPSAIGFITDLSTPTGVHILAIEPSEVFNLAQPILASLSLKAQQDIKPLLACLSQKGNE
jgi:hypothetical protein